MKRANRSRTLAALSPTTEPFIVSTYNASDPATAATVSANRWRSAAIVCVATMALSALTACGTGTAKTPPPPALPTVTIAANPATVADGTPAMLSVTASNATQIVISDSTDSTTFTLAGTGGTQSVTPSATTTYTATATGPGGTASAKTSVTVTASAAAPTVTITASPTSIAQGGTSTLTVTATNATQVSVIFLPIVIV